MRVLVLQATARDKIPLIDERFNNRFIRVTLITLLGDDALAFKAGGFFGVDAVVVDGERDACVDAALGELAAIRHPNFKVFAAVRWGGVHEARTCVVSNVIAVEEGDLEIIAEMGERMGANHGLESIGRNIRDMRERDLGRACNRFRKLVGEDVFFADLRPEVALIRGDFIEAVRNFMRIGDRAISGQRPRCCRPDDDGRKSGVSTCRDRKLHPNHITRMIVIFDFGFSQRRLFHHRPHHGFRAAIQKAVVLELHDLARDLRFGVIGHCGVGMIPITRDAQALEFLALHREPMLGEIAALFAEFDDGDFVLVFALSAVLLFDFPFDRQAVAIPTGDVVGVKAEHLLAAGDEILQHLVERMADMDIAVGVGRAVMQHKARAAGGGFAQALVKVDFVPARHQLRLALRQACAHRKFRLREKKGFGIIALLGGIGHGFGLLTGRRQRKGDQPNSAFWFKKP